MQTTQRPILQKLQLIFADVFDDPQIQITETTNASEIPDWDSVAQVKLVLAIEEAFNIRFTSDEVGSFASVGDVIRSLQTKASDSH
jgi:acyl carrier protein